MKCHSATKRNKVLMPVTGILTDLMMERGG